MSFLLMNLQKWKENTTSGDWFSDFAQQQMCSFSGRCTMIILNEKYWDVDAMEIYSLLFSN